MSEHLKNITTAVFFSFGRLVAAVHIAQSPLLRSPSAVRGRLETVKKQNESGISDSEPASVLQA